MQIEKAFIGEVFVDEVFIDAEWLFDPRVNALSKLLRQPNVVAALQVARVTVDGKERNAVEVDIINGTRGKLIVAMRQVGLTILDGAEKIGPGRPSQTG